jgi:hypothetical protein
VATLLFYFPQVVVGFLAGVVVKWIILSRSAIVEGFERGKQL